MIDNTIGKRSYSKSQNENYFHILEIFSNEIDNGKIHWSGDCTQFNESVDCIHSTFQTALTVRKAIVL